MESKKLAIVLHGISYHEPIHVEQPPMSVETMELIDNYCSRCKCKPAPAQPVEYIDLHKNKTTRLDYRETIISLKENVINVLTTLFQTIDIYVITYSHPFINELQADIKPKDILVLPEQPEKIIPDSDLMVDGLKMIQKTSIVYDNILCLRFDNYYPIKFPIDRLNMDAVNVPWKEPNGKLNDCFTFLNYKNLATVINTGIPLNEINYLCERINSPQEFYPDFFFPQKRLDDYTSQKLQLVEISPISANWCMSMVVAKHIVIITSCINTDNSPLCYYPIRSLYTPKERMEHTMVSIATVREKIPNVTIILINNNELTHEQHKILTEKCDHVFIFDSLKLNDVVLTAAFVKTFSNKSCSETASLYYACERIREMALDYDYLWKLSGRSYLRPEFNLEDWPPLINKITGPPRGHGISSSLYNIPKQMVPYYMERLKYCCLECYRDPRAERNSMVEWKLFEIAYNLESTTHYFLPCLAQIAGLCTVDASHTHWAR